MSQLRNGEEVLDERIFANRQNGQTNAPAQQPVSDQKKGSLNPIASRHHTANDLNEKSEVPRSPDPLQHPLAKSTTDATAAHDRSHELRQTQADPFCSVRGNVSSALEVSNPPPLIPTTRPMNGEKTEQQDQDDGHTFPEGGLRAWLVVLGSLSGMTASFGILNSAGTFQAYLSTHQLAHASPSAVGWIFSLYAFLTFFCGVQIGPVFDAYGPRWLVFAGTVFLVGGMMGVAESTSKC